jgi:hypothetical protein
MKQKELNQVGININLDLLQAVVKALHYHPKTPAYIVVETALKEYVDIKEQEEAGVKP